MPYTQLSGYKQAADLYNKMYEQDASLLSKYASTSREEENYNQQLREYKLKQLAAAQKEQEQVDMQRQLREEILKSVANDKYDDMLRSGEIDSSILLESKAKEAAAEAMRRGQQGIAKSFLEDASKYGKDADISRQKDYAIQQKRMDSVIEDTIAAPPTNSTEWAITLNNLLKNGIDVPPQYQKFTPESQAWLKEKGLQVKTVRDAEMMKARAEKMDADIKNQEKELTWKKEQDANKAANEQRERERQDRIKGSQYSMKDTELFGIMDTYFKDGPLSTLDSGQAEAANELVKEAQTRYIGGQYSTLEEARNTVKKEMEARVVDGKLTAPVATKPAEASAKPQNISESDAKNRLGNNFKPGYRYWIEGGRIKGEPL